MLDRLPTELISLIIDGASAVGWQRKTLLDALSTVSKTYRLALRPLRDRTVHVPRAAVIPVLRTWPAVKRQAVDTLFVGPAQLNGPIEPFRNEDYTRLMAMLPNVKYVYSRRVQGVPSREL
ncbi:hypothetical protein JCM3774_001302 [Rhodotorula dairenensis]